MIQTVYLYLISPLHTGGATQEGNLLGIAREAHTELPYIPSSSIRGRLRAKVEDQALKEELFGNELKSETANQDTQASNTGAWANGDGLKQGSIWIGDGSILWFPVPSLSHGVVWVSSPMLLRRWTRFNAPDTAHVQPYSTNLKAGKPVYLKDAILKDQDLIAWPNWQDFIPQHPETGGMSRVMVLPDHHCQTLMQMSLWRQVKVKLDAEKSVDGGFRYEEAISPDTLMYFTWGVTTQKQAMLLDQEKKFQTVLESDLLLQIGGQESLGRGFTQAWLGVPRTTGEQTV